MTTDPYVPIDCDRHSTLEVLAMRHAAVTVRARDEAGVGMALPATVVDVLTRSGAEYLVVRDEHGCEHRIRLDRLQALYDAAGVLIWGEAGDSCEQLP